MACSGKDAPPGYGPDKTLHNRFILADLVEEAGVPERLMIDSTRRKAHRTAAGLNFFSAICIAATITSWLPQ